jgi:chromosome segregation ATPase
LQKNQLEELSKQAAKSDELVSQQRELIVAHEKKLVELTSQYNTFVAALRIQIRTSLDQEVSLSSLMSPSSSSTLGALRAELQARTSEAESQRNRLTEQEDQLSSRQNELTTLRGRIVDAEKELSVARDNNKQLNEKAMRLKADTQVVSIEKQQMERSQIMQFRPQNSSNLLETLNLKLRVCCRDVTYGTP